MFSLLHRGELVLSRLQSAPLFGERRPFGLFCFSVYIAEAPLDGRPFIQRLGFLRSISRTAFSWRSINARKGLFSSIFVGSSTCALCRGEAAEGDSLFPWDGEKRFPNKEIGEFEGAAAESLFSAGEPAFSFWEVFSSDGADGKKAFLRKLNNPKLSIPEKNPLISQFSPKIAAKARHFCLL